VFLATPHHAENGQRRYLEKYLQRMRVKRYSTGSGAGERVIAGDRESRVGAGMPTGIQPERQRGRRAHRPSEGERELAIARYQQDEETWDGLEGS
jgi:hypothetical protein